MRILPVVDWGTISTRRSEHRISMTDGTRLKRQNEVVPNSLGSNPNTH